ncbi:hypothetical protein [Burkholderia cepacia]|uniref:hypothetical protein n=1 Tax=Burkholderia cepacia TaxID=292 RepID=UPI0012D4B104|nr:hypothetical protein [Burkholderia cepacia]
MLHKSVRSSGAFATLNVDERCKEAQSGHVSKRLNMKNAFDYPRAMRAFRHAGDAVPGHNDVQRAPVRTATPRSARAKPMRA